VLLRHCISPAPAVERATTPRWAGRCMVAHAEMEGKKYVSGRCMVARCRGCGTVGGRQRGREQAAWVPHQASPCAAEQCAEYWCAASLVHCRRFDGHWLGHQCCSILNPPVG
jgi:hypothetical protein